MDIDLSRFGSMMGRTRSLVQGGLNADLGRMAIKSAKTRLRNVVLVCRECTKKLDGGFGRKGNHTLKTALRKHLKAGKGRKATLAVVHTPCFDICPKTAVVAVNAARPDKLLIVPPGSDLSEVAARLGLDDDRRPGPVLIIDSAAG